MQGDFIGPSNPKNAWNTPKYAWNTNWHQHARYSVEEMPNSRHAKNNLERQIAMHIWKENATEETKKN